MKLWLDDIRDPTMYGHIGWVWVKTADEAIKMLATGNVTQASLDHDLDIEATLGNTPTEKTGYDVVLWMEEHNVYPINGVTVHSMNPSGKAKMEAGLRAILNRRR